MLSKLSPVLTTSRRAIMQQAQTGTRVCMWRHPRFVRSSAAAGRCGSRKDSRVLLFTFSPVMSARWYFIRVRLCQGVAGVFLFDNPALADFGLLSFRKRYIVLPTHICKFGIVLSYRMTLLLVAYVTCNWCYTGIIAKVERVMENQLRELRMEERANTAGGL